MTCSEEDKKFFQDAMRENTIDIVQRMREITMVMSMLEQELKDQGVTTDDLTGMSVHLASLIILQFHSGKMCFQSSCTHDLG